ncbi:unnamed protein product [Polarella glacialis]|uniref:PA domain-containing protein n=1 Tax=Polarella glacialis TaxID=89957 RepID=A0A813HYH9_POLGL|nr:unnamed protein product [Polarella glacialis]
MQRLIAEATSGGFSTTGWRVGRDELTDATPPLAPMLNTAMLAAVLAEQVRERIARTPWPERPTSATSATQASPAFITRLRQEGETNFSVHDGQAVELDEESDASAGVGRMHLVGDLADLLGNGPQAWRCGPLVLFDRFDLLTTDPYHEVDLLIQELEPEQVEHVEQVGTGPMVGQKVDGIAETDSMPERPLLRVPAAFAEWSRSSLAELQTLLEGRELVLPQEDNTLALQPLHPDDADGRVAMLLRGNNSFAEKAANAAAGGAVAALICNHEDGPLFRMGAGQSGSEAANEQRLPSLLLPNGVGQELRAILAAGRRAIIRRLEPFGMPRTFVCVGEMKTLEGNSEVWVVADPSSRDIGAVLLVPPQLAGLPTQDGVGPERITQATVLAPSVLSLLTDLLALGRKNVSWLARRAPQALALLRGEADSLPSRQWREAAALRSGVRDSMSGAWHPDRGVFAISLSTRRVLRGWLHIAPGEEDLEDVDRSLPHRSRRVEPLRALRPLTELGLEALLDALGNRFHPGDMVYAPARGSVDVLSEPCLLLEEPEDAEEVSCQPKAEKRRLFQSSDQVFERVSSFAPSYVRRRWRLPASNIESEGWSSQASASSASSVPSGSNRCRDVACSCHVAVRDGQLCVRWSDSLGCAGSFQKPMRSKFSTELLVAIPACRRGDVMLNPGDLVLVGPPLSPARNLSREGGGCGTDAILSWRSCEDDATNTGIVSGSISRGVDVWEEAEELIVMRACGQEGEGGNGASAHSSGATPRLLNLTVGRNDHERVRLLPGHWCLLLSTFHGAEPLVAPLGHHRDRIAAEYQMPAIPGGLRDLLASDRLDQVLAAAQTTAGARDGELSAPDRAHGPTMAMPSAATNPEVHGSCDGHELLEDEDHLELQVFFTGISSLDEIELSLSPTSVQITIAGNTSSALLVDLPCLVQTAGATARFSRRRQTLTVRLSRSVTSTFGSSSTASSSHWSPSASQSDQATLSPETNQERAEAQK